MPVLDLIEMRDGLKNVGDIAGDPDDLYRPYADLEWQRLVNALLKGLKGISPLWVGIGVSGIAAPRFAADGAGGVTLERQDGSAALPLSFLDPTEDYHGATKGYVDGEVGALVTGVSTVFGRPGAVVATAGDYSGALVSFTPAGSIAATNVQAAIAELDGDVTTLSGLFAALDALGPFVQLQPALPGTPQTGFLTFGDGGTNLLQLGAALLQLDEVGVARTMLDPGEVYLAALPAETDYFNATPQICGIYQDAVGAYGALSFPTGGVPTLDLVGSGTFEAKHSSAQSLWTADSGRTARIYQLAGGEAPRLAISGPTGTATVFENLLEWASSLPGGGSGSLFGEVLTLTNSAAEQVILEPGALELGNAAATISIGGQAVVGPRGAAVADATGAGDVVAQLNFLLTRCRAHGLIAP